VSDDESGPAPRRILVVDDEPHIRRLLATRLEAEGYDVAEADDGVRGLAALEAAPPDLVLLDVMMPGASGLEVLATIRAHPEHAALPVIILTAKGQDGDRELAMAGGATDFITKPFSPMKLLARIRDLLDA
jgi:DNA-binding response OmpR family regulator